MKNTSVNLEGELSEFVNKQVSDGRYNSVDEVIREGLRMLLEKEQRNLGLRLAIEQGKQSGTAPDTTVDEFLKKMHIKHLSD